ncbi:MAG: TatD family hydrolase [Candidatus Omnitrophica bacterium]|nr:TatD family hydrolase [Candidatus Omnitrophota bacterium]
MIIDTHTHLDHIKHVDEALVRAYEVGVEAVMAVGIDAVTSRRNLELSQRQAANWPKIYLAFGMHPSEANVEELKDCILLMSEHVAHLKAVGEIGLDFWYPWVKKSDVKKDVQRQVFRRQLEFAKQLNLPVIVHSRGAWDECYQMVMDLGITKALFHWYSGPVDVLTKILDAGFYMSATPSLAYSPQAREAVNVVPLNRLLVETDSPVTFRRLKGQADGKDDWEPFEAEPKDVFKALDYVAEIKKQSREDVLGVVNDNAKQFFRLTE